MQQARSDLRIKIGILRKKTLCFLHCFGFWCKAACFTPPTHFLLNTTSSYHLKLIVLDVIKNYLADNLGIPVNIGVIRKRTETQHRITSLLEHSETKAKYSWTSGCNYLGTTSPKWPVFHQKFSSKSLCLEPCKV